MSSPWDPAIAQTMQRHGGSNRSIPKSVQLRVSPDDAAKASIVPHAPEPDGASDEPTISPDRP